ncbi:hypothetical protein [Chitinophaga agri]|uniref:Uncharacterized protein n=1 Tax=Chitinophaga agri TaxID=2703787 RepID=A0A6B9ZPC3_9BACT|nr:hypothetical protein [Chitinophaga agri]QHS63254.1 hypothetical protein GWR21_27815 [Chitinophaga agri]
MSNEIINYEEHTSFINQTIDLEDRLAPNDFLKVKLSDSTESNFVEFQLPKQSVDLYFKTLEIEKSINALKHVYAITAIKNLLKKNHFLQLNLDYSNKLINEEEFEREIDDNPDRFIIEMTSNDSVLDLYVISELIEKIGNQFTIDEVSELFSIDTESLHRVISKLISR